MKSLVELNSRVAAATKGARGWPARLTFTANYTPSDDSVTIRITAMNGTPWKQIDPWSMAFLAQVRSLTDKPVSLSFAVPDAALHKQQLQFEAFKRRLSYLNEVNDLKATLDQAGTSVPLYSLSELSARPDDEVVRDRFRMRGDTDTPGRLEKDFQAYLFGKGKHDDSSDKVRSNERLALFGKDFLGLQRAKEEVRVEREFPTGVFKSSIKRGHQILATEYVDLVTINRNRELSVIEIKFDDNTLEVIAQTLNYALFFNGYRAKLTPLLDAKLAPPTKNDQTASFSKEFPLVTYVVSNTFHPRFRDVFPFYAKGNLAIRQIILGHMITCENQSAHSPNTNA
jgi:hypothetical protein